MSSSSISVTLDTVRCRSRCPGAAYRSRAANWRLRRIAPREARAQETQPLEPHFSHGDFTYTQLIFDGSASGLVDFDTICQAEPALDLGQFLAYARVTVPRARHKAALPADHITENICGQFLNSYIEASAASRSCSEERLRARVPVYEAISLLRIALHSWQKLKGTRLEYVISVLEERVQRFGSN
jgi:thiamine kinase-like enzyme